MFFFPYLDVETLSVGISAISQYLPPQDNVEPCTLFFPTFQCSVAGIGTPVLDERERFVAGVAVSFLLW